MFWSDLGVLVGPWCSDRIRLFWSDPDVLVGSGGFVRIRMSLSLEDILVGSDCFGWIRIRNFRTSSDPGLNIKGKKAQTFFDYALKWKSYLKVFYLLKSKINPVFLLCNKFSRGFSAVVVVVDSLAVIAAITNVFVCVHTLHTFQNLPYLHYT